MGKISVPQREMGGYQSYRQVSLSDKMNRLPVCDNGEKEVLVGKAYNSTSEALKGTETWEMEVINLQITVRVNS